MEIYFSKRARNSLQKLLDHLETEWSSKVKHAFISKLDIAIETIADFPESCPVSRKRKGIYKCVVSKQTSFYYRIKKENIEVIVFYDNRMNPKKKVL